MAEQLELRYLVETGLRGDRGPRLLRYLLEHGADEFSVTVKALHDTPAPFADAFETELGPFERATAPRRTTSDGDGHPAQPLRLWTLDARSLQRLLSFVDQGIVYWPPGPDGWLEDLTVYRREELVLGLLSHERQGILRLDAAELAEVAALDIAFETMRG